MLFARAGLMKAKGSARERKETAQVKSDPVQSEASELKATGRSRLLVLVADDEQVIARIKALAITCVEIEGALCASGAHGPLTSEAEKTSSSLDRLTQRQLAIALSVAHGLSNKDIGRELGISHFTVRNHLSQVLLRLGLSSRQELRELLRARSTSP